MKLNLLAILFSIAALSLTSPFALAVSKNPEYVVKSFMLVGDEVVSDSLTTFSQKHSLVVISCDIHEAELICVFQKR